ncbi:MAG TPA: hypothetical protein VLB76_23435 [Thermoanaerobaculia bacterium]|jgi:hypothetical protein|nr:hypothetical protein [Thermoanaerobaculia bacterium]
MSQSIRRVLAVTGLVAALLFSLPAPSQAAGLRGQVPAADFMTRAWSWIESLLPSHGPVASTRRPAIQQKDSFPAPIPSPVPPSSTTGQGNMIDPDGVKHS